MLTSQDLQSIRQIVKEEVHAEVKKELKPIKIGLKKVENDLKVAIHLFDNDIHSLHMRLTRVENHLHL